MAKKKQKIPPQGKLLVYQTDDGQVKLDVRLENESLWLTQPLLAELFQTSIPNISMHIRNIYEEGELVPKATVKKFLTVRREGARQVKRDLEYYNLDMIISVGYRVKSGVATRFRIWATERLREYIVKGFTMDDDRLKNIGGGRMTRVFSATLSSLRAGTAVKRVGQASRLPVSECKRDACTTFFKKSGNHTLIGMERIPDQHILRKEWK